MRHRARDDVDKHRKEHIICKADDHRKFIMTFNNVAYLFLIIHLSLVLWRRKSIMKSHIFAKLQCRHKFIPFILSIMIFVSQGSLIYEWAIN